MLNLQQNRNNALEKILEMFVKLLTKFLLRDGFGYEKLLFSFLSSWFGKY